MNFKWPWLYVTDRQKQQYILGISRQETIDFLSKKYPQYEAITTYLRKAIYASVWPSFSCKRSDTNGSDPLEVVCNEFNNQNKWLQEWQWWFSDLKKKHGGTMFVPTAESMHAVDMTAATLTESLASHQEQANTWAPNPFDVGIDPHLCLNTAMEGTFGQFRMLRTTFNAQHFLQLVAHLQRGFIFALHPDAVHTSGGASDSRRYQACQGLKELQLTKASFTELRPMLEVLQKKAEPVPFGEADKTQIDEIVSHCREMIVRGNSLRASYYKLDWRQETMYVAVHELDAPISS